MPEAKDFIDKIVQEFYSDDARLVFADFIGENDSPCLEAIVRRLPDLIGVVVRSHLGIRIDRQSVYANGRDIVTGFNVILTWDGCMIGTMGTVQL